METGVAERGCLSGREWQVAELAVTSASVRAIAESLFISVRTVEAHLGTIYRKLGIGSRTELVALLSARPQPRCRSMHVADQLATVPGLVAPLHFVGRADELATIIGARAAARSSSRIVLVGGESGAGKSSLLATALAVPVDGPAELVLGARCIEGLNTPFGAIIDALAPYLRAFPGRLDEVTGPNGGILANLLPDVADRLPVPRMPVDPAVMPRLLMETFHHILRVAAVDDPVVLVLEDVHWANQATVTFLRSLFCSGLTYPICVIVSFRDTELTRENALGGLLCDLWNNPSIDRVNLGGLSLDDAIELVAEFTDSAECGSRCLASLDRERIVRFHKASAGNALYLTELLRLDCSAAEFAVEDQLPVPLVDVVNNRVDRLGKASREVLEAAAACGLEFSLDVVEEAARRADLGAKADVLEVIEQGREAGLLSYAAAPGTDCRFVHDVVRQTLQESVSPPRRARLHAAIGHALASRSDDPHVDASVADHLSQSNDPDDRIEGGRRALRALHSDVTWLAPVAADRLAATVLARLPGSSDADAVRLDLQIKLARSH